MSPPFGECCAPVTAGGLHDDQAAELAAVFKVLADPARLRLLSMVAAAEAGEACACDLVEPVGRSQPTVSHHLSTLVDAGLLTRQKRGKWAWYRVVPERLDAVRAALAPTPADRQLLAHHSTKPGSGPLAASTVGTR